MTVLLPARAAQGRLRGQDPGGRPAALLCRAGQGHLWNLQQHSACAVIEVPPQGQASSSVLAYHLPFSLCQLFLDVALQTSHHDAEFWDVSQTFWYSWPFAQGAVAGGGGVPHHTVTVHALPCQEDTRAPDRLGSLCLVPELKWLLLDNAPPTPPCTSHWR